MTNQSNRVTTAEAARLLGINVASLRYWMEIGQLDIGRVVKAKGSKRKTYLVFRDKLDKEMGKIGRTV